MITRALGALLLVLLLPLAEARAAERQDFTFVYLLQQGDPAYDVQRAYTGLKLRERKRPLPGAETAIREVRILGRALGIAFKLESVELPPDADPSERLRDLMVEGGYRIFLLDLPVAWVRRLASDFAGEDVVLFNIRHRDTDLRQENCGASLFHTIPSLDMHSDALAQFLAARDWRRILVLEGEAEADKAFSSAIQASARKFGLSIVAVRPFVLSNDPRQREQNNIKLLTGSPDHDVVFLADGHGEFGRYVPYGTYAPRPVVGSEGLISGTWHWTWERHGAPQLNQRFDKVAGRLMSDEDWAAWAAVRAVVEAAARSKSTDIARLHRELRDAEFTFDLYKGFPGSFRPWNRQLRQAMLLHTHNAVIDVAPLPGFLHARNNPDTLGSDEPENRCPS